MSKSKFVWLLALVGIILSLVMATSTAVLADWEPGDGHKMHFPQLPDEEGWDVNASAPVVLADDWGCSESGWVKDIHFWGSWMEGYEGEITSFVLSIHANIPADPDTPYSRPGETLWEWGVDFDSVAVIPIDSPYWEGWYDPSTGYYVNLDHNTYFQYNVFLPDTEWFWQEAGTIYWLNISAIVTYGVWGWKSSTQHWADDGCWAYWGELVWNPLYDPETGTTLDLAFVITGGPEEELDFGDCPDPNYPTLLASNGANHIIVPGVFLGASIDPEPDGQPDPNALGDDTDGNDDEDGVVFTSLAVQGNPVNVKVTASVGGALDAWVDFNADGDWADAGEQIFASQALVAGVNYLTFNVPTGAAAGITYSRFRFSTAGGLSYTGQASDGEVEDYRVFILKPVENIKMHWPQTPDLDNTGMDVCLAGGPLADDWMCTETGAVTDIHFWGSFRGDTLPEGGARGLTLKLTIRANIPPGVVADWSMPGDSLWSRVFGFGDYQCYQIADNNPEDWYCPWTPLWWNDDHLQVYQYEFYIDEDPFVQLQDSIYWLEIEYINPPGFFGWKTTEYDLRWNDDATWLCDPPAWWCAMTYPEGHEYQFGTLDLAFVITGGPLEELDFGDCPDGPYPTLLANDGARHIIVPGVFLGASIDPEPDGQPTADAMGDDNDGNDDEDGVIFTSPLIQGQPATVKVTASIGGFLDAWIDFNSDGDWADAGEQIFNAKPLVAGVNNLNFTVPAGAQVGTTYSRFRFSTIGGLSYTGQASDGEVEDYEVYIEEKPEPGTGWWFKSCYPDYAFAGMPDFDEKQDNWVNPEDLSWSFCGPTAVANCFWWIDSRFEALFGPGGGLPNDGFDYFPLVRDYLDNIGVPVGVQDDHCPENADTTATLPWTLMPPRPIPMPPPVPSPFVPGYQNPPSTMPPWGELIERLAWVMDCDGARYGTAHSGTYVTDMQNAIHEWLADTAYWWTGTRGLDTLLYEHTAWPEDDPEGFFPDTIEPQVKKSQDVILLLGIYYGEPYGEWYREYGHYVTIAGVNSEDFLVRISDPCYDWAEPFGGGGGIACSGGPGCVHNGIMRPHGDPHGTTIHNDAGNASHDEYPVAPVPGGPGPGGPGSYQTMWQLIGYPCGDCKALPRFAQNLRKGYEGYQNRGEEPEEKGTYWTFIEAAVLVSPYPDYSDAPDPYPEAHHSNWTEEWLGESVSADMTPRKVDRDTHDDGVQFFEPYNAGQQESLKVTITVRDRFACETAHEAHGYRYDGTRFLYLHGWIDWNDDDDWYDAGENIFSGVSFDPSTWTSNSFVYTHIFTVPADAAPGTTWARFRLDYHQDLNDPAGQAYCGEVEDYHREVIIVSVPGQEGDLNLPQTFELAQNYPNPFNLQTAIRYQIPEDCRVTLEIHNLLGQKVRILVNEDQKTNAYTAYWDGKDTEGKEISSGIYFYTLRAGKFIQTRKMVILK